MLALLILAMAIQLTEAEVSRYYGVRIPNLKRSTGVREWRCPCPIHHGKRDSFSINPKTGFANCHSGCAKGWDVFSFEQEYSGTDFDGAKLAVFDIIGRRLENGHAVSGPRRRGPIEKAYDYLDSEGRLRYQVVRHRDPKEFSQRRPAPNGNGWIWKLEGTEVLPYRLPALILAESVWVVEGEKDADNLTAAGAVATCNSGGAGNFREELAHWFQDKSVAIIPDNDKAGKEHALKVASMLYGIAKSIRIVEIPDLPEKGDVSDFLAGGGTLEQLSGLYESTAEYSPEACPDDEDKYVRTLSAEIEAAGGINKFWDLTTQNGIPTPWEKLTSSLAGGLLPGEVYAIGADTGNGKTSMGLQFIIAALRAGHGVLMFSMEMNWRQVFQRLVAIEARVDLNAYREAQKRKAIDPEWITRLNRYTYEFSDSPLYVSVRGRVSPTYMIRESDRLKRRYRKLDLIVVDHMQLMGSDERTRSEYEKFTEISRALKQSAKELNVPVLVMSQTSRAHASDKRWELTRSDLRGSGAIEEDLAGCMLIYADKEDAAAAKAKKLDEGKRTRFEAGPVKTWLKLDKNRYGADGVHLALAHLKKFTRFDLHESVSFREE